MAFKIWDVPAPDKVDGKYDIDQLRELIPYFDGSLSYELTGYRPLTKTQGLDFDPKWFTEAALAKEETGSYTKFPHGSKSHREWWKEEILRCRNGYTVNGYRVTGDHYFFLNYYTMRSTKVEKAGAGRTMIRSTFVAKQYEFFHYIETCEYLGRDVISFKARGVGFSEIMASLVVRGYTTNPNYVTFVTAYTQDLMEKTLRKCWYQLDWLNINTEGAMRRARMVKDSDTHKRASLKDKGSGNEEYGHMSEIIGVGADKSNKIRGDRADRLIFEEGGSDPILKEKYTQAEPLVELLGDRIGTRFVIGTGGDNNKHLAGLEDMYLNPAPYLGLPYKHSYTENGEPTLSGFFIPAHAFMFRYQDERGVTDEDKAREYYEKRRAAYGDDVEGLMLHCAEYCFYAEEALIRQGQNDFDKKLLSQQVADIKIHKTGTKIERGNFFWVYQGTSNKISGVKWAPDNNGKVYISEHPLTNTDSEIPLRDLYVAGIDSIDHGVTDSVVGESGSKFAILIKKRTFGNSGDKYVAGYIERPLDVREAYTTATQMMWYYGCKGNLEDTKIGFRKYLQTLHLDKRFLMLRPNMALDANRRRNATLWGTPGSEKMIRHGLSLIASYILDYCHNIPFLEVLEQLLKFSYDRKGAFDWVMAMVYAEIGDEDMFNLKPGKTTLTTDNWADIGYYTDENGRRRFGVKPSDNTTRMNLGEINVHLAQSLTQPYNPLSLEALEDVEL